MNRIVLKSMVGADGVLQLTVAVGVAEADQEVRVTIESEPSASQQEYLGFVERTAGAWQRDFDVRGDVVRNQWETDMTTIVLNSTSGPDGTLHLEVPVGAPNTEFEVEVLVRPRPQSGQGWPPGYFDLFGSIDDETFTVHPQPPLPPPQKIE
jgi:hypothetical protein